MKISEYADKRKPESSFSREGSQRGESCMGLEKGMRVRDALEAVRIVGKQAATRSRRGLGFEEFPSAICESDIQGDDSEGLDASVVLDDRL